MLRGCLQANPEDRLRPEELLELEWFATFREPPPFVPGEEGEEAGGGRSTAGCAGGGGSASGGNGGTPAGGSGGGAAKGSVGGGVENMERQGSPQGDPTDGELGDHEEAPGEEEHSDLDQAVRVVREYIERAVEGGVLVAGVGANGQGSRNVGGGGVDGCDRRGSSGCGMIQTMRRWAGVGCVYVCASCVSGPRYHVALTHWL